MPTLQSAIPASMIVALSATTFAVKLPATMDADYMTLAEFAPKGTPVGPFHGDLGYLSLRDDGSGIDRVETPGAFETCTKDGHFLVFVGWGTRRYLVPFSA